MKATPDQASRMYIERAIAIAEKYAVVFGRDDPSDAFVLTDDFHSAGRISGAKRILISELKVGSFHRVENKTALSQRINRSIPEATKIPREHDLAGR